MRCSAFLLAPLAGCAIGLDQVIDATEVPAFSDPADTGDGADPGTDEAGARPTTVSMESRLYRMEAGDMVVTEPPGLDGLWDQVLSTPLLVYVDRESADSLELVAALAGADGLQNPCEKVRRFPAADWSHNPAFAAGPGELDTSFAGHAASFRELQLSGVVDEYAFGWRDGTLDAELDTRELQPALGMNDVCAFVEDLGGSCHSCADGEAACFHVRIEEVQAEYVEADFDVTPDARGCER